MTNIFSSLAYKNIEKSIIVFLSKYFQENYKTLFGNTTPSPRTVGDNIEELIRNNFPDIIKYGYKGFQNNFERRAMADFAFTDKNDNYYTIDVKTHRENSKFNMPNLTSVERLARYYRNDKNFFVILFVSYEIQAKIISINLVHFIPIEYLNWDCLTVGALGWGQIQIANANEITINPKQKRKNWMLEFCEYMLEFYPREIDKTQTRIKYFEMEKEYWTNKN